MFDCCELDMLGDAEMKIIERSGDKDVVRAEMCGNVVDTYLSRNEEKFARDVFRTALRACCLVLRASMSFRASRARLQS